MNIFTKSIPVRVIPLLVEIGRGEQEIRYDVQAEALPMTWRVISQKNNIVDALAYVDEMEETLRVRREGAILRSARRAGDE